MKVGKVRLSFWQILNMNVGFLGIQFSFGLQQTAVNPIFSFLGAHHEDLPLLNLAGPVTGLLIQPIIGAISDKTWSPRWGRRKPFFLLGAILGSLCLFAFPFSPSLWFAVGLLWILDAANNTAMEPYRAFVGDKLNDSQLTFGYQMQSLFVGAGIVMANASLFLFQDWFSEPVVEGSLCVEAAVTSIPKWVYYSFFLGAITSVATILWSVIKTPEIPPSNEELLEIRKSKEQPLIARILEPIKDITRSIGSMPKLMKQLSLVYFFQWYALFIYWQFIAPMLKSSLLGVSNQDIVKFEGIMDSCKAGETVSQIDMSFAQNIQSLSEQALSQAALMNGTYNFVTMIVALLMVPLAAKYGNKKIYVISLFFAAIAMLSMPFIHDKWVLLAPMVLLGIGWAAMMGIPYAMVSRVIPEEKRGLYMGIVNMMIVIPMLIQTVSFGPIIKNLLNNSAVNAIIFGGVFFTIAGVLATRLESATIIKED